MKKTILLLFTICLFFCENSFSQGYLEFTENKGQWDTEILYQGKIGNGLLALTKEGYRVLQYKKKEYDYYLEHSHHRNELENHIVNGQVWNIEFVGANKNFKALPSKKVDGISNYFLGNDPSKWASECKTYINVTYQNVYDNIDINFYSSNNSLKYDIIVKPGGDPSLIRLKYKDGVTLEKGKKGEAVIKTGVGEFVESSPYTYQVINYEKQKVSVAYKIVNNEISFRYADYDKTQPLIIDPTLIFSTHSGSTADNWGFTATYDTQENFYGGGFVQGNGFPVSGGSFQTSFGGGASEPSGISGTDMAIIKLNQNGSTRVYATYIGGSNNEQPHSMICDAQGNLVIAGRTKSTNYPNNGVFGTRGGNDIVVTKLNAAGTGIVGSIIVAGNGEDGVNINTTRTFQSLQFNYGDDGRSEVNLDAAGNILVAACSQSANFFTTPGALQTTLQGTQDAVIIKINPAVTSVLFSTFFGGAANDAAYVISAGPEDGNIYFAGGTESNNLPSTAGTVQPTYSGGADGYIGVINATGTATIRATYMGTPQHDQLYGIQFDRFGFPYVMGISLGNMTPVNAAFSNAGSHQIIAKLSKDLSSYVYFTKFGTNNTRTNISPVAFLVDNCENVYVSGWGNLNGNFGSGFTNAGTTGLPITPDAIQNTTDGKDFYYFVLERNATSQLFGSFFGGRQTTQNSEHVDGGTSRFDPKGTIYQAACASCSAPGIAQYPTTAGTFSPNNPSGNCNLGMTKIRFNYTGVKVDLVVSDTIGCNPLTVTFSDRFLNSESYVYDFGDGTAPLATTNTTATHTYTTPGVYIMRLIGINLNSCNLRDTAWVRIKVRHPAAPVDFNGIKQPPCLNLSYQFNNLSVAPGSKPFTANSFRWDFGDGTGVASTGNGPQLKTYAAPGTYNVKLFLIDTNYCNYPDSAVKIFRLSTTTVADFNIDGGCQPHRATITNSSVAALTFQWDFGDGGTSTDEIPNYTFNNPGTFTVRLIVTDPNTCNLRDTMFKTITIFPKPDAGFTYSPNPSILNTPTQFNNTSLNATKYNWVFGDGETSTLLNPLHQFLRTGTFNTCLYVENQFSCRDTICKDIPAIVEPLIDVPNAFTPNGDGINDQVTPRGFGVKTIMFRVFNRWGQLVFETNQRNVGWNGKFKGQVQPMDSYSYTLSAEFFDGKSLKKSGDITLIR